MGIADVSQTNIIAWLRLAVMLVSVVMFVAGQWDLLHATAVTLGVNTLLTSYGFLKSQDANVSQVVSQTTVQDVGKGKQEVVVTTEVPPPAL